MISPPYLKKGDKVAIAAPARKITREELLPAIELIEKRGLNVVFSEEVFAVDHQFAGNDSLRSHQIQNYLDDHDIKAILFARGGYGSVRIIDKLNFELFRKNPCWLIGYSDVTVLLNHIPKNYGIATMHATMPINFITNTPASLNMFFDFLLGNYSSITITPNRLNKFGVTKGELVGGNLSVLYSLLGSISFPETAGRILFLEDLDEYLYHIDRMMIGLKRARKLKDLNGIVVGGMTDMNDNTIPYGKTANEIILEHVAEYNFPVCFDFPAGHINNNLPLIIGNQTRLEVTNNEVKLEFL